MTKSNEFNPSDNQIIGMAAYGVTAAVIGVWGLWALAIRPADFALLYPWVAAVNYVVLTIIMISAKSATWKQIIGSMKPLGYVLVGILELALILFAAWRSGVSPHDAGIAMMFLFGGVFTWFHVGYMAHWKEQALKGVLDGDLVKNVEKLGFYGN